MTQMNFRFHFRRQILIALLFLLAWLPHRAFAGELFPGYLPDVREQALRLLETARPGKEEALEREVQALRKEMLNHSIVSMNEVPDRIFERARKEGWEGDAGSVLRPVTRIAPFSAVLWAWLVKEDLRTFRIRYLLNDIEGFRDALRWYGPAFAGCSVWVFLCVAASVFWFAVWTSLSLLLRAQPAITADFARIFRKLPAPELFAFAVFLVCLLAPVLAGAGLGVVVVFWLILSSGYLRRWEIATALLSILLLAAVYVCCGAFHSVMEYTGEARQGGWFGGEGYFSLNWPEAAMKKAGLPHPGSRREEMVRFAMARAEMQSGRDESAESLWTEWIRGARDSSAGYNNRGIVRQRLGKTPDALKDFERAMETGSSLGPAYWNSYQIYLETLRLEDAAKIQETAWNSLYKLSFFDYRAEELRHGELLPSPLLVKDLWKDLLISQQEWFQNDRESPVFRFLFRPLSKSAVLPFIIIGCLWMPLWRFLSSRIWIHSACRSCGGRALVTGNAKTSDICNQCRTRLSEGIRAGEEREVRLHAIATHGRYVKACSIIVPGAGMFWAGKTISLLVYGILLSSSFGILTVSMAARGMSPPLISGMMKGIASWALAALFFLWAAGAAWSWKSFHSLQCKYNLIPRR